MTHLKAIERIISLCPRLYYRETFVLRYLNSVQVLVFIDEKDRGNFLRFISPEWLTKFRKFVDYRLQVDISAFSNKYSIEHLVKVMIEEKILTSKELLEFPKNDE